jgi:hypothetical protein
MEGRPVDYVWYAAACVLGLALGLAFGRLLAAFILHWENTDVAYKATTGLVSFALGGGAGAGIFAVLGSNQAGLYVLFLAVGMTFAYFLPLLPSLYTVASVRSVVRMSDALRDRIPDEEERVLLILSFLVPYKEIQQQTNISKPELEHRLEQAADAMAGDEGVEDDGEGGDADHGHP